MVIKSSLFSRKSYSISLLVSVFIFTGCQSFQRSQRPKDTSKNNEIVSTPSGTVAAREETEVLPMPEITAPVIEDQQQKLPKFGVILGPGMAKTYAHIGFLQELHKSKAPVVAVAGIEWGAAFAAIYSQRESVNDVEWQMMKLKDDDFIKRNLVRKVEAREVSDLKEFFTEATHKSQIQEFRLKFACPAFNYKSSQSYVMARGSAAQALSYCIGLPPIFKPFGGYVAAPFDIQKIAEYLKSNGATYIVYVDVLSGDSLKGLSGDTYESIYWHQVVEFSKRKIPSVDAVVSISTSGYGMMDFEKRRDLVRLGSEKSYSSLRQLLKKWNL